MTDIAIPLPPRTRSTSHQPFSLDIDSVRVLADAFECGGTCATGC